MEWKMKLNFVREYINSHLAKQGDLDLELALQIESHPQFLSVAEFLSPPSCICVSKYQKIEIIKLVAFDINILKVKDVPKN